MVLIPFLMTPKDGSAAAKKMTKMSKSDAQKSVSLNDEGENSAAFDGIPTESLEKQHEYFLSPPTFVSFEDTKLQRGIGAEGNGAGGFGSDIRMQNFARRDVSYADLSSIYGSWGTHKNKLSVGTGLINNQFSFDGQVALIGSNAYAAQSSSNMQSYFLSGAYYGAKSVLRANIFLGREGGDTNFEGVPESGSLAESHSLRLNRLANNPFEQTGGTDSYKQDHFQLLYTNALSDKFSFSGATQFSKGIGYYEQSHENAMLDENNRYDLLKKANPFNSSLNAVKSGDILRRRSAGVGFYSVHGAFNYKPATALQLTVGGAYNQFIAKHFDSALWVEGQTVATPVTYYKDDATKTNISVFGKTAYQLDDNKTTFSADVKYRQVNHDISTLDIDHLSKQKRAVAIGKQKEADVVEKYDGQNIPQLNFFNYELGVKHQLTTKDEVHASFAVVHKEPRYEDYMFARAGKANYTPEAEQVKNVQLGYRTNRQNVKAGVTAFGRFYKNQLIGGWGANLYDDNFDRNVGDSYRIGLELDGKVNIHPKLTWTTTGVISRNRISEFTAAEKVYKDAAISFSPDLVISNELAFKPMKRVEVAFINKYIGKQYKDNTQNESNTIDAFFVDDLRLSYTTSFKTIKNLGFTFLVNNVFGAAHKTNSVNTYNYVENGSVVTKDYYLPSNQPNFLLGVNMKF